MAITIDDFDKIWASTSPLTPYTFSESNYKEGWNFIGSTPPSRQMWDGIQKQNDEKFKYLRDNFGTPNIVTQASQMTDTDKVYVYLGSEAGWNSGHWYYYDEGTSSWADGGVYNSVAFVTDTTLSIAGQPADAKATGDALALKSDLAGCTFTGNVSVNADFSVTGDATIGTDLSVTGISTLTGNVSANGDVTVVGDVSSANMTTSADATIGGDLSVTGATSLTGNVTAGDVTANDVSVANIIASNNANIGGNAIVTGSVASASLTTTADGTIGGNLSVSGTTALAGTSTAPTPSVDDNSTKIATTEYVQTELKPIETKATIDDKRISNIEKLLEGNLYDYQTDTDSKYTKTVLSGAMPYASLEQIGGRTVVWNQLMQNGNFADTSGWSGLNGTISASDNVLSYTIGATIGDNTYTNLVKHSMSVTLNHKFFVSMDVNLAHDVDALNFLVIGGGNQNISFGAVAGGSWKTLQAIFTKSGTGNGTEIQILSRNAFSAGYTQGDIDKARNVMLTDLTSLYGAGNEPSTVSEFQQTFPAVWYAYNPGSLLSAGVTEVVSKKADTTTLETYPIPAEVQALEGYGWSVQLYINNVYSGDVYNQIDFENKKYIQNVGKVTLNGSESWTWDTNNALAYTTIPNGFIVNAATQHNTYVMSSNPSITSTSWGRRSLSTYTMGMYYGQTILYCKSSNFTSANDVKTYFTNNPTDVNYVLQNPVETDISAYLTDDNLIEVEAGGTLTFENQHGDDYRINVPSSETYMVDLQSAI